MTDAIEPYVIEGEVIRTRDREAPARLPCVVCGVDLIVDQPDPKTGHLTESMNVHTAWQPFVCLRCFTAAQETAHASAAPPSLMDASEPTDEQTFAVSALQIDEYKSELLARTLVMMARNGYLGQSRRVLPGAR